MKHIIITPHITEKSMAAVTNRKYTFIVDKHANKIQISQEIKRLYKVNPTDVTIVNIKGKEVMFRQRYHGKKNNLKKAVITLAEKESIKEFAIKE